MADFLFPLNQFFGVMKYQMNSKMNSFKNVLIQKFAVSVPRDRFVRIKYQMNTREVDSKVRFL